MTDKRWPNARDAVNQFYRGDLRPVLDLWDYFHIQSGGSGRRSGPRNTQWLSTLVVAYAALEAGLENIVLAAHGHRNSETGQDTLSRGQRKYLVENPLSAPSATKIERILFAHFGIELGILPDVAQFTATVKPKSHEGDGRGSRQPSPSNWADLKGLLQAVSYIRNAFAHGDTLRPQAFPNTGEGSVWVRSKNGETWTVQQPHALTGIRTIIGVYNAVAHALEEATSFFGNGKTPLQSPDDLISYNDP